MKIEGLNDKNNENNKEIRLLSAEIRENCSYQKYAYGNMEKISDFQHIKKSIYGYDVYAFRFKKTEEQVIEEYLNNISSDADLEFIDAAKASIKVRRVYFPVRYVEPVGKIVTKKKSYGHYETTGYKGTGEIKNGKLDVSLKEEKSYKIDGYDTYEEVEETTEIPKYLSHLSEDFYYTNKVDASAVIPLEEIAEYCVLSPIRKESYYYGKYDEDGYRHKMLQLLFFPVWHIEVNYKGKYYYTEISDVKDVKPKNYLRSKAATEKIVKEIDKIDSSETSYFIFGIIAGAIAITAFIASMLIHFGFFDSARFSAVMENGILSKLIALMNYENIDNGILKLICAPFYLIFNVVNFLVGDNILGYLVCVIGFLFGNGSLKYKDKLICSDIINRVEYIYASELTEYRDAVSKAVSVRKKKIIIELIGIAIIIAYNVYLCSIVFF